MLEMAKRKGGIEMNGYTGYFEELPKKYKKPFPVNIKHYKFKNKQRHAETAIGAALLLMLGSLLGAWIGYKVIQQYIDTQITKPGMVAR